MKKLIAIFTLFLISVASFSQTDSTICAYFPFNGNTHNVFVTGHSFQSLKDSVVGNGVLTKNRFGIDSSAYHFTGNSSIIITDTNWVMTPDWSKPTTISFWFKQDSLFNSNDTILKMFYDQFGIGINIYTNFNKIFIEGNVSNLGSATFSKNVWHNVNIQYIPYNEKNPTDIDTVYCYIDTVKIIILPNSGANWIVGNNMKFGGHFIGDFDDFRMINGNSFLTTSQIDSLYITCDSNVIDTTGNGARLSVATTGQIDSYQWQSLVVGSKSIWTNITGENSNILVLTDNSVPTAYRCHMTSIDGDIYSSPDTITKIIITTGINENTLSNFKVYPNPMIDKLFINYNSERSILSVLDISGREVFSKEIVRGTNTIDVSALSKGIYLVRLDNNITKIVKN